MIEETATYNVGVWSKLGANVATNSAEAVIKELDVGGRGYVITGIYTVGAAEVLADHGDIKYVEIDGKCEALGLRDRLGIGTVDQTTPWGVERIGADETIADGHTGEGAHIAIIDTGIDAAHETLEGNLGEGYAPNPCEADGCDEDWDDVHGHGTHVAGTAAAMDNGLGVVGVAPDATLHAVKVLGDDGSGSFSDVADGLVWAANQGYDIANMSLGGPPSEALHDAVRYARDNGVLLVAAAGNGLRENTIRWPAKFDECMAISAISHRGDWLAWFSSYGEQIDLAAPGLDVLSAIPDDQYDEKSGTSMAAPHVAGVAALVMARGYSNEWTRDRLHETAEDIGLDDKEQGSGLVDAVAAVPREDNDNGDDDDDDDEPEPDPDPEPEIDFGETLTFRTKKDNGDDNDDDDDENGLNVETLSAANIERGSASLHGELTDMGGHDRVEVYFEWREAHDDLPNSTSPITLSVPTGFSRAIAGLEAGTWHEFRAVAESA